MKIKNMNEWLAVYPYSYNVNEHFFIIITHINKTTTINYLHIDANVLHTKDYKFTVP